MVSASSILQMVRMWTQNSNQIYLSQAHQCKRHTKSTCGSCLMAASSASSSACRRSRARFITRWYSAAISPATS